MNILFLSPHTDDVELGCAGTISKMKDSCDNIFVVVFSVATKSLLPENRKKYNLLYNEFNNAMDVLSIPEDNRMILSYEVRRLKEHRQEILDEIIDIKREINPDIIFIPSTEDIHQDHQLISEEAIRVFKKKSIFGYELPWNNLCNNGNAFFKLKKADIDKKYEALSCYKSQIEKNQRYFDKEFIYGLARIRGTQIGVEYAESFQVIRQIC